MKGTVLTLAASALLGVGTTAASIHERRYAHAVFHDKRHVPEATNETCGCTTIWSTWYGEATLVAPVVPETTSVSTSTSAPPPPPTTSKEVTSTYTPPSPPTTTSTSSVYVELPKPSSSAAPVVSSPKADDTNGKSDVPKADTPKADTPKADTPKADTPKADAPKADTPKSGSSTVASTGGSGQLGGGGSHYAVTYVPYGGDGRSQTWCKHDDEIAEDIAAIAGKGFSAVRIYSTDDCEQLPAVHKVCKAHGLKLILGIFFKDDAAAEYAAQVGGITDYFSGNYDDVALVLVGNECISSGTCDAGTLAELVAEAKTELAGSGYGGPVSTALIVSDWQDNADALCDAADVVAGQIHPFFSTEPVEPDAAGDYFDSQFDLLQGLCEDKPVLCTEVGWPHKGSAYRAQTPGAQAQAAAIGAIRGSRNGDKAVYFSNADDMWKFGQQDYEMYFGCLDQF